MTALRLPNYLDLSAVQPKPPALRRPRPQKLMFISNGRLDPSFGDYQVIFDVLRETFQQAFPGIEILSFTGRLSTFTDIMLAAVVADCVQQGIDGAVIALCDFGISRPSALLAGLLEEAGIPTCMVCEGTGIQPVETTSQNLGRVMPYVVIGSHWWSAVDKVVRAETAKVAADVVAALTRDIPPPPPQPAKDDAADLSRIAAATDPSAAFGDYMAGLGLSDGLPMIAPTADRVAAMLEAIGTGADTIVWKKVLPRSAPVTAADIASVAVMCGCRPDWMWAVKAAYEAMAAPEFRLSSAATTTHPSGLFVFASGPKAAASGISSGPGCLGPGHLANATIGRAVAIGSRIFLGAIQGKADLTQQGSPAEFSFCCAENLAESPWPSAIGATGGRTAVMVLKCEGPRNVLDHLTVTPATLLDTFAGNMTSIASNNAINPRAQTVVLMNPLHAHLIADGGWTRTDVQRYLFEHARVERSGVAGRGTSPKWPKWYAGLDRVPIAPAPEDIIIAVAGAGGIHSQIMIPWGDSHGVTVFVD